MQKTNDLECQRKKDAIVTLNTEDEYQNIIQLVQQWLKQNNILK